MDVEEIGRPLQPSVQRREPVFIDPEQRAREGAGEVAAALEEMKGAGEIALAGEIPFFILEEQLAHPCELDA